MSVNIPLTKKQAQRAHLMHMVLDGSLTLIEAAAQIGISYRQAKRLKKAVATKGCFGVVHGNTGKKSRRALDGDTQRRIIDLARFLYQDLNIIHLAERLQEEQRINVSRETVRKILKSAGLRFSSTRRPRRVKPFLMASREGKIVLWGGLTGAWFPQPHPECSLMAAIDAATLKCLAARFFPVESNEGFLWLLKKIVSDYGIPEAMCQYNGQAVKNRCTWTLTEELRGGKTPSQAERALQLLGIMPCHERKKHVKPVIMNFRSLLLKKITSLPVTCITEGNLFVQHEFIFDYNRCHAFSNEGLRKAWREVPAGTNIDRICSTYHEATVDSFNMVRVEDVEIKIPPGPDRISYAMARVEVRRLLNGIWHVYYKDRLVAACAPLVFPSIDIVLFKHYWPFKTRPARTDCPNRMYTSLINDPAYRHII